MYKITESLKKYLDEAGISHQTLFNSDCGLNNDYPTSTCFYLENEDSHWPRISFIVDIFPKDSVFYISACPMWRCDEKDMALLEPFKAKWNRCGMRTSLVFEERGITVLNAYCFYLGLFGICDSDGLGKNMWKRYFEIVVADTYTAMMEICKLLGIDDMANESGYCGEESNNRAVVLMREIDEIFIKNGLKPPVYHNEEGYYCFMRRKKGEGLWCFMKGTKKI